MPVCLVFFFFLFSECITALNMLFIKSIKIKKCNFTYFYNWSISLKLPKIMNVTIILQNRNIRTRTRYNDTSKATNVSAVSYSFKFTHISLIIH